MKKRILLVEEDTAGCEMMLDRLKLEAFEAQAASDLASARAAVMQVVPGAVVLEVGLGGQRGLDLAARMQRRVGLERTPVIAVTAHAMITNRDLTLMAGRDEFIPKPLGFKLLPLSLGGRGHGNRVLTAR